MLQALFEKIPALLKAMDEFMIDQEKTSLYKK